MPTSTAQTWAALQDLLGALAGQYRDDFRQAVIAAGLGREPVGMLLHAGDIDQRPLAAARACHMCRCVKIISNDALMVLPGNSA